jgi:plasmid rolling circle replication initiator protein Rep
MRSSHHTTVAHKTKNCALNLTSKPQTTQTLSAISPSDDTWRKRKRYGCRLAQILNGTIEEKRGKKMLQCATQLGFRLATQDDGSQRLKLAAAQFCRDPFCPTCIAGVSRARRRQVVKALPKVLNAVPGIRFIHLVLTIRNPEILGLRKIIKGMHKAFTEMMKDNRVCHLGYIRALEVTIGETGFNKCHPHFHVLIAVPPEYFDKNRNLYLSNEQWSSLWTEKLGVNYTALTSVSAVKKNSRLGISEVIGELIKYTTKPTDLLTDRNWTLTYMSEILGLKRITTAGIFREHLRVLEKDPDDLIGKDDTDDLSSTIVWFRWDWQKSDYIIVNNCEDSATQLPFFTTKVPQY